MTTDFLTLRSLSTGKTGDYPAHFAEFDDFEIADPEDASCVDCVFPDPPVEDGDEVLLVLDDEETDITQDLSVIDTDEIDNYFYDEEGENRGV
jgi:hypothetical protein